MLKKSNRAAEMHGAIGRRNLHGRAAGLTGSFLTPPISAVKPAGGGGEHRRVQQVSCGFGEESASPTVSMISSAIAQPPTVTLKLPSPPTITTIGGTTRHISARRRAPAPEYRRPTVGEACSQGATDHGRVPVNSRLTFSADRPRHPRSYRPRRGDARQTA